MDVNTESPVRITDERVLACLDLANPDIGGLWELCVHLEWNRQATVAGIAEWLGPPRGQRILDCACGSGFPGIDLAARGYDITCSDGSSQMLDLFRRNATLLGVPIEPVKARWDELAGQFGGAFDVVMCRGGGALLYAGTWDDDMAPDRGAVTEAVRQFVSCLRPGGRLYVDTTRAENLARLDPQRTNHPPYLIGDHVVEFEEVITTDPERRLRLWHSRMRVDGESYVFQRRSHYLPHDELVRILLAAGLTEVRPERVRGESYAVFVGSRPAV